MARRLALRATLLVVLLVALLGVAVLYVLYARGVFEHTQRLVLVADDSEGVSVGMDLSFAGFAIGRVQRIELADDASVRILVDVPRSQAHWLRQSSIFTLNRGLVGNTSLRAFSGVLTDPPMADGAVRRVLVGDASAEIPRMVSAARELVAQLSALTSPESPLAATLANVQLLTAKLNTSGGALDMLLGKDAAKLTQALARINTVLAHADALMAQLDGLVGKVDGLATRVDGTVGRADAQLFGAQGLAPEVSSTVRQVQGLLRDAQGSLKRVDGLLDEAQGAAANVRGATVDLGSLRTEVEASLRRVEHLINDVNRQWPFARDSRIKLP